MTQKVQAFIFVVVPENRPRWDTADHKYNAPCLQVLLFARAIVNIGDFYYCVLPNGVFICIYKILEIN